MSYTLIYIRNWNNKKIPSCWIMKAQKNFPNEAFDHPGCYAAMIGS